MKNYVLGCLALVLAISFSAFTKTGAEKPNQAEFYWFPVDQKSAPQSSVDIATLNDEETNVCPGNASACKDGYSADQVTLTMGVYTATGSPDYQIREN